MVIIVSYSFSTLKPNQLFHRVGGYSSCYIYIISIGQNVNVLTCWTKEDNTLKKIEFEALSRSYWNDSVKLYYKIDKRYNKKITQILYEKAIQSIFTYNEYYFKNSSNWGN